MDSKKAREIAIRQARLIKAELPVCSGCPAGRFEESVDRWMKKLGNLMRQATFLEWRYVTVGAPPVMFVLQAEQLAGVAGDPPLLEVPIARVDTRTNPSDLGGSERRLAIIGPEADEVAKGQQAAAFERDVAERDRIGEILENQQAILEGLQAAHKRLDHLQSVVMARDGGVREMLQRVVLLVNHHGMAPLVGSVDLGLLGQREIVLGRPQPDPKPEPTK